MLVEQGIKPMARRRREPELTQPQSTRRCVVPTGAPAWVTPELLGQTLAVWQPYYQQTLTVDDALGMILDVTQLLDVLSGGKRREAVRRLGSRQFSRTRT